MYYLRKEPYESTIQQIVKTNGEVIPERKYMTEDRALYKANDLGRFYRRVYTGDKQRGFRLYKVKKIASILKQRQRLFEYCGELFDIYNENGKVDMENLSK